MPTPYRFRPIGLLFQSVVLFTATACGHTPSRLGVLVNAIAVTKSSAGSSPTDAPFRGFVPGTQIRVKLADVAGDAAQEILEEMGNERGLQIKSQAGRLISEIESHGYLTDFGAVRSEDGGKDLIVLYTYPNPQKGGTFAVMRDGQTQLATWDEFPPPGRFGVGDWAGHPALFYLQDDWLIVRSPSGTPLQRLLAPEGHNFREVYIHSLASHRTVVVASGSGYTPYHMVCIYDSNRLVYQDIENEHAFGIEAADGGSAFVVTARTNRWKYSIP